jgi:hypothetical protein
MKNLFRHLMTVVAVGGFAPTLIAFYIIGGWQSVAVALAYFVALLTAIVIN